MTCFLIECHVDLTFSDLYGHFGTENKVTHVRRETDVTVVILVTKVTQIKRVT